MMNWKDSSIDRVSGVDRQFRSLCAAYIPRGCDGHGCNGIR